MAFTERRRRFFQESSLWNLLIIFFLFLGFFPIFRIYWNHYWEATTMSGTYSHAPLALLIFFFLIWRKRNLLIHKRDVGFSPRWGYAILLSGVLLKIYGEIFDYSVLRGMTLIPILFGILMIKFPRETTKGFIYPILFLLFIVPVPTFVIDQLTLPLQNITTSLASYALDFMGYQIERYGHTFLIIGIKDSPGFYEFVINQNCSGIRFLVALFALGTLYVYFRQVGGWQRLIMILAIIPLSILGNSCRVLTTVFMVFYVSPRAAEAFFHTFSGVLVFCFTLAGLFIVEKLVRR